MQAASALPQPLLFIKLVAGQCLACIVRASFIALLACLLGVARRRPGGVCVLDTSCLCMYGFHKLFVSSGMACLVIKKYSINWFTQTLGMYNVVYTHRAVMHEASVVRRDRMSKACSQCYGKASLACICVSRCMMVFSCAGQPAQMVRPCQALQGATAKHRWAPAASAC